MLLFIEIYVCTHCIRFSFYQNVFYMLIFLLKELQIKLKAWLHSLTEKPVSTLTYSVTGLQLGACVPEM